MIQPGDTVRLRKAHPCGGREWRVTRVGAEVGLACLTCGRHVLLPRDEFDRRSVAHTPAVESQRPDTNAVADPSSPAEPS